MHATDYHGSPIRTIPRTLTHDPNKSEITTADNFQKQIAEAFLSLSSDEFLSIKWTRQLLDTFLLCQTHFRSVVHQNRSLTIKPPVDRLLSDYYERIVKALDVCNAIRDGIERIRRWEKLIEIVLCALGSDKALGEGQFRRAKKALIDLAIGMLDEKDSGSGNGSGSSAHRNRSFSRSKDHRSIGNFRSLSWSVSRSWSAAKQIQAIGNNLNPPRGNEIIGTGGLAVAVYAMGSVVLLVMWALVAAIPCQDRGLQVHFSIPRQFPWGAPMVSVYEKVVEESKKRERKNACGLLREIYQIEKCTRLLSELVDSVRFPLSEENVKEVRMRVEELGLVYGAIKEGLDPLERQVREVFHRIVRDRTEGTSNCPV